MPRTIPAGVLKFVVVYQTSYGTVNVVAYQIHCCGCAGHLGVHLGTRSLYSTCANSCLENLDLLVLLRLLLLLLQLLRQGL
jgi:hypothetical protein